MDDSIRSFQSLDSDIYYLELDDPECSINPSELTIQHQKTAEAEELRKERLRIIGDLTFEKSKYPGVEVGLYYTTQQSCEGIMKIDSKVERKYVRTGKIPLKSEF